MQTWMMLVALALTAGGALYTRLRWRRAPQAYRAMMVLASCYFVAGSLAGAWVMHLLASKPAEVVTGVPALSPFASPAPLVPTLRASPAAAVAPFDLGSLRYDPDHAALPNAKFTPGDIFSDATKNEVCTPGWASEHRHVTESMRDQVYVEYGKDRQDAGYCGSGCEVDHLIPLELGGSNDIKNLWPQPGGPPLPGDYEKDQLENELHRLVCSGKMPLADAQRCIASNWVQCWEKYALPLYGPPTGTAVR